MLQFADCFTKCESENRLTSCRFAIEPKAIEAAFHGRSKFLMVASDCETLREQESSNVAQYTLL